MHEHAAEETTAAEPAAVRPALPGAAPLSPTVATLRMLQRSAGNQAALRWLARDTDVEMPSTLHGEEAFDQPVPLAGKPAQSQIDALQNKYSVTVTGPWSDLDFKDLEDGLKLLTSTEAKRLSGFDLVRVSTLNGASGLTTMDGTHNKIEYADEAFDRGSTGGVAARSPLVINGGTQGRHVVCHEVGHVVLYTNATKTAENTWNKNVRSWITKELSPMKNGQVTASEEELYCEAFAVYKTGPSKLQTVAPGAHTFFSGGSYLS